MRPGIRGHNKFQLVRLFGYGAIQTPMPPPEICTNCEGPADWNAFEARPRRLSISAKKNKLFSALGGVPSRFQP